MLRTSFTVLCTRFSENEARNTFTFSLYLLQRKSFRVLREADGRSLLGLLRTGRTIKPEARKIVPVSNYLTKALKSLIDCYCFNFDKFGIYLCGKWYKQILQNGYRYMNVYTVFIFCKDTISKSTFCIKDIFGTLAPLRICNIFSHMKLLHVLLSLSWIYL